MNVSEPIKPRLRWSPQGLLTLLWRVLQSLARTRFFWIAGGALFIGYCGT
jgi:hypothetical protein